jgi:hypothetical protein
VRHKPIARAAKAAPPSSRALHFHIGSITLQGYSAAEQRRFQTALKSSLARIARNVPGAQVRAFTLRHLDAGQLAAQGPEAAARHLAARIVSALGRSEIADA